MYEFIQLLLSGIHENSKGNSRRDYIYKTDASGKFALCLAAEYGGIKAMRLLMEFAPPDSSQQLSVLKYAMNSNKIDVLEILLGSSSRETSKFKNYVHLVIAKNKKRSSASHRTTKNNDDIDEIMPHIITTYNFSYANYDGDGFTPLLLAAKCGNAKGFKLLWEKAPEDKTKLLKEKTTDVRYRKLNILHLCAEQQKQNQDNQTIEFVYNTKQKTIQMKDENLQSSISDKADGHITICKYLFDRTVNLSNDILEDLLYDEDDEGNTPLHLACEQGYRNMCELLIGKMIDLSKNDRYLMVQDLKKRTPLHECAQTGDLKLAEILLSSRPNEPKGKSSRELLDAMRDSFGRTPLHLACVKG